MIVQIIRSTLTTISDQLFVIAPQVNRIMTKNIMTEDSIVSNTELNFGKMDPRRMHNPMMARSEIMKMVKCVRMKIIMFVSPYSEWFS